MRPESAEPSGLETGGGEEDGEVEAEDEGEDGAGKIAEGLKHEEPGIDEEGEVLAEVGESWHGRQGLRGGRERVCLDFGGRKVGLFEM